MALDEFIDPGSTPVADIFNVGAETAGGAGSAADPSLLGGLLDWAKANPQLAGAIFGGSGPLASLLGNLASGGISGTTSGTSNTSGTTSQSQSGFSNQQQNQQRNDSGFSNTANQQSLDPAAQMAMDRLTGMLGSNAPGAQGAYNQGLSMLQQLATGAMGQMNGTGGVGSIAAPNTTPSAAPVTGFPSELPTAYNPAIGNLIKQAFGSFTGDLASNAITNARGRGFAGGADLLGTAAAPMMGQSLAQVPAMEAKAYLDHVLQAYDLQSQNASREAGANAGALNAATNALGPGISKYAADVSKYGIDRSQNNQQLSNMTSLLQALMGPQNNLMAGNLNLLNSAPRGSTQNTLTGGQSNQNLSNTTQTGSQSLSQSQQSGNTTGQTATPLPRVVGSGIGDIIGGIGTGITAGGGPNLSPTPGANDFQKSLLKLLGQK